MDYLNLFLSIYALYVCVIGVFLAWIRPDEIFVTYIISAFFVSVWLPCRTIITLYKITVLSIRWIPVLLKYRKQ